MPPQKQFSSFSLVLNLGLICAVAGLALAFAYEKTKGPIEEAKRQEKLDAIRKVLPEYANQPDRDARGLGVLRDKKSGEIFQVVASDKAGALEAAAGQEVQTIEAYPGRDGSGKLLGWAIPVSDPRGYGGTIKLMVGVDPAGKTIRIEPLEVPETPGLGDAIKDAKFLDPMLGKGVDDMKWKVRKDGGGIDGVTAATISSRAAIGAVASVFPIFKSLEDAK